MHRLITSYDIIRSTLKGIQITASMLISSLGGKSIYK
ncbi:hypothetical protein OESDEN_11641 [Oesophagostomum dentatum]|uniref:Uncharacterized protein n=1 Tax=Oesophagostomum dentatum TaxID=61180 RepID=A0A0B1STC6_OESDE|nr:hypothetical protein OESDEN_11641 [Oesophagostomum dentatum]